MNLRMLASALAGAALSCATVAAPALAASVDSSFQAAINRSLANSDRPEVAKWTKEQRSIMASCIGEVTPSKKKEFILAGGASEFGTRFEKVKAENRFELERKIRSTCLPRVDLD